MKTFNEAKILQDMESEMDSVVHDLIHALDDRMNLICEYYTWQEKVQAKMKELHPDFEFKNF
jgi:hypothetical protein